MLFSDEIYEEILSNPKVMLIPCDYRSTMIHVIEDVIAKKEREGYATIYELQSNP